MTATVSEFAHRGAAARVAARGLASTSTSVKDAWLRRVADLLETEQDAVLEANQVDVADARDAGLAPSLIDRLLLTSERLRGIAADTRAVAALPDPVGEMIEMRSMPNGLQIGRRRVPLGVIGSIYESRPNVTVDIAALCVKAGNAVILRGGKEARRSNRELGELLMRAAREVDLPEGAVQVIEGGDRALVGEMLQARDVIDLMIPRGSDTLIRRVYAEATMPVVAGGIGVCHTYVDGSADLKMAVHIAVNAKTRRVSICNALDTLLVDRTVAHAYLPSVAEGLAAHAVRLRCDPESYNIIAGAGFAAEHATDDDWGMEFLDYIAAIRVVDGLDGALEHIDRYGSGHSEAIITESYAASQRFLAEVDAAAVYVNASTQFTDGAQFGLGAEVGISTQKMHARGPLGLRELTSYKWVVMGSGQTRP